jgi:hypothetical protein
MRYSDSVREFIKPKIEVWQLHRVGDVDRCAVDWQLVKFAKDVAGDVEARCFLCEIEPIESLASNTCGDGA